MRTNTNNPLVYVIVLNWNGWQDTLECLASLEVLDYPNYQVLVVDNGSTDDSVARIRRAYPEIALIEIGKNLGFAGGNNEGIRCGLKQAADYIWLLNNDTVAEPNALSTMVNVALDDRSIGAVGSVLYHMFEPSRIQTYGGGRIHLWTGIPRPFTASVPNEKLHYIIGASLLIRRSVFETLGLLDDSYFMYWEESDYQFRMREAGWRLAVASESKIWHKESAALGKKSPILAAYFNASAVRFFKRYSSLPLLPICIGVGGRFLKRVVRQDWKGAKAVWQGAVGGWKC